MMAPRPAILMATLSLTLATPACDRQSSAVLRTDSATFRVLDSAGIEIVENSAPERPPGSFWTIDSEPEIVIGGVGDMDGAADDSAHMVWNATGLVGLPDGRVAVLSGGNRRILLFESSGEFSTSIGRRGDGPGEFSLPEDLQYLSGDTLVVWDEWFGAVSYFDTTGVLLRERFIDLGKLMRGTDRRINGINAETPKIPLSDGSFVVVVPTSASRDRRPRPRVSGDIVPHSGRTYIRIDSAYGLHSFGSWDGGAYLHFEPDEPGFPPALAYDVAPAPIFAAGSHPLTVYISPGEKGGTQENEIRQFSPDGTLLRIVRRTTHPIPVTKREREENEERIVQSFIGGGIGGGATRRVFSRIFEALPTREFHSPIYGLHVDTDGHLWVLDSGGERNQWSVFGPGGRWLGILHAPLGFECTGGSSPCWIGKDLILGVTRRQMGVERVEGYRLNRHGE